MFIYHKHKSVYTGINIVALCTDSTIIKYEKMCTRYLSKMLWMLNNCIKHKELNNSIFTFLNKDITVYRSVSPTCQNKISQQFVIRFALDMSLRNLPRFKSWSSTPRWNSQRLHNHKKQWHIYNKCVIDSLFTVF